MGMIIMLGLHMVIPKQFRDDRRDRVRDTIWLSLTRYDLKCGCEYEVSKRLDLIHL